MISYFVEHVIIWILIKNRPIKPLAPAAKGPFSFANNSNWDQQFQYPHQAQFAPGHHQETEFGIYQSPSPGQCPSTVLNHSDLSKQNVAKSFGNFPQYHTTSLWNSYGNIYHNSVIQSGDPQNTKLLTGQNSYQGYQSGYNAFTLPERSPASTSPLMFSQMQSHSAPLVIKSETPLPTGSQSKRSKRCKCPNCTTTDTIQVRDFFHFT